MISSIRTDMALEAGQNILAAGGGEGLRLSEKSKEGIALSTLDILDPRGEAALGMPKGRYVTMEPEALFRREQESFAPACRVLAEVLSNFLNLPVGAPVLVAGLGNREITPDAVGPLTVESVMVTRHLRQELPEYFGDFRPVSAVCSGVLGTTGIESGEVIASLCRSVSPAAVIAVDALAARSMHRLCRSIQVTDSGIIPGSGVGNARKALNRETLGVPVIAVGVPTVVDAATLAHDVSGGSGEISPEAAEMVVTPRDIDRRVREVSRVIAYGVNLALHEGITVEDVDMFLG